MESYEIQEYNPKKRKWLVIEYETDYQRATNKAEKFNNSKMLSRKYRVKHRTVEKETKKNVIGSMTLPESIFK